MAINGLIGKLIIEGKFKLLTGLHIGGVSEFSAIGSVDSVVVRDPLTKEPYLPGSSIKGKMRYLLARIYSQDGLMKNIEDEDYLLKRLFGSSGEEIVLSRLQFFDLFMTRESVKRLKSMDTDLYLSEIKSENTINRISAVANPRQIERVPTGAEFEFKLVYNLENSDELEEDMKYTGYGLSLIEDDYIGGSGSRGYGRIKFIDDAFQYSFRDYSAVYGGEGNGKLHQIAVDAFKSGRKGVL